MWGSQAPKVDKKVAMIGTCLILSGPEFPGKSFLPMFAKWIVFSIEYCVVVGWMVLSLIPKLTQDFLYHNQSNAILINAL